MGSSNPSIIYTGNDGGIFKSTDSGATWNSLNTAGFNATQFESLSVHPTDPNFSIGGTQDNGTELLKPDSTWNRADFGDGGFSAIDQNATNTTNVTMYHTYFNGTNSLIGFASITSGVNATEGKWHFFGCQGSFSANGITCDDTVLFYAPLTLGPGNPNTVYFGSDRLYRSANGGTNNVVVSQAPFADGVPVSAIGISPQDDNVRIVGLQNGSVFATSTGANPLTDVTGGWPAKYVARAVIDPTVKTTAYITLDGYGTPSHIWKTTNLSAATPTWTATGFSVDVPVNAFVVDPGNTSFLYAGTDIGVFLSRDGGATWNPYGNGLPRVAVFDMKIVSSGHKLRIGTHGRGAWEIPAAVQTFTLTVNKQGTGSGTVTSNDGSINCGATCSADFDAGTMVTLTATPAAGSRFAGWGGACSGSAVCVVTMNSGQTVFATFNPLPIFTLQVTKQGTGSGAVSSNDGSINCGSACSASFTSGTMVTLTAIGDTGSVFDGWRGACSGTQLCTVTMNAAQSVSATFTIPGRRRAVAHPGSGTAGHPITTTVADSTAQTPDHYELLAGMIPPGLTFTFANGQISGTPTPPPTIYDFTVAAVYPDGQRVFREIAMPICQSTSSGPTSIANIPVNTFYFIGTIPGGNPPGVFRYDIVYGSLPPGMTLDANTGTVSGAPTVPGTYQYKIGTTRLPGLFVPACPLGFSTDAFYQATVSCSTQCQTQYEGYNDGLDTDNVWGWAWDKSQPNTSTQVDVYDSMADTVPAGSTLLARINANLFRQDLVDAGKGNGNHAFVFQVPDALKDGNTHRIHATFAGTLQELSWSPRILAASTGRFVGAQNNNGCNQIDGYALDNWQINNPIDVDIFDNGQFLATVVANFDSNTVPATSGHGAHGFLYFTPDRLRDGTNHLITINFKLSGLPLSATNRTLSCAAATPPSNPSWEGWLDNVTCDRVDGWAWDATRPNSPIDVAMFADGVRVATLTANQFGQDLLNAGKGNGVHRYFHYLPDFLKDNTPHYITMQIVGQNTSLPISSGITNGVVSCAALPPPTRPPLRPITNTSTGTNTTASSGPPNGTTPGVDVTFSSVSVDGLTSFVPVDPSNLPELPVGYGYPHAPITPMAFDISTTASYSGPLFVTFTILSEADPTEFANLRILHLENGTWQDRTYFVSSMPGHHVIALTNSLSPFVIACILQNTTPASISVSSTWNSIYGENVAFTAVVSSSVSVPTGTVTFMDGSQFLATVALDSQGQATMSTRYLTTGTHQLSASYNGNGMFSPGVAQFIQVVSPAALFVGPDSASRAYGDANPAFTGVVSGLQNGDNITASYFSLATAASPVGAYSITASLSDPGGKLGNYTVSQGTAALIIQPAILQITTSNKTRTYGDANPILNGDVTGIRNADNVQVQYSTTATAASVVGAYPITPTLSDPAGRLGNYIVSLQNGSLTITPAALQVTANNKTHMYGDPNPPLDGTITGVHNNDNITAQYSTTATAQSLVGTYPITASLSDPGNKLGNYTVTIQNGTLTVTRSSTALAAPAFNPPAGTYPPGTSITITDATSSTAAIHYTTDGTTPTAASPLYTAPIVVNANVFIKAMATQPEYLDSSVSSALFSTRISISASPSPQQLLGCASISYTVTVPVQTGVTGTLTLNVSGLPAGATASFSPATLTNSGSSTLTVNTSTTTPSGTYPLTITVSNPTLSGSVSVSMVVQDFNIATTGASQTVTAGGIASYSLSGSVVNSFAGSVALTLSGLPTGATATFTPAAFTGAGNSILNVTTATSTPPGTYTLTVTGTSGCRAHTLPLTLIVNAPPPTGPNISSLSVTAGPAGTAVTINGVNFGATQGTGTITFNGLAAQATAWSANSIAVKVPRGAKTGNVVVTSGGQISNGLAFTVQDDAVHIFGTNCATCGWQITDFTIQVSPVYGYTIRSGDILYFYESQNSTSVAGIEVCFPSGEGVACADNGLTVDQDNKPVHADTIAGVTHFRSVDLSPNAGQVLSQISFHSHGTTKTGRWDVYFSNVEIVSADGSVRSIFVTGSTPGLFKSSSFGVAGTGSAIEHNHVW